MLSLVYFDPLDGFVCLSSGCPTDIFEETKAKLSVSVMPDKPFVNI